MAAGDALRDAQLQDESFIAQYLSPSLIRDMRLFSVLDDDMRDSLEVSAIHDDSGYQYVRQALSRQYDIHHREPNIQVWAVNTRGIAVSRCATS